MACGIHNGMTKINDNNSKLNDKLDGFQNIVIALDKMVKLVEIKLSKHETEILECKAKVTQNSTDYVKKEELNQLMKEHPTATSYGISDMAATTGRGLSIETILMGQAKNNAAFQMASRSSMIFNGEVEKYVQNVQCSVQNLTMLLMTLYHYVIY